MKKNSTAYIKSLKRSELDFLCIQMQKTISNLKSFLKQENYKENIIEKAMFDPTFKIYKKNIKEDKMENTTENITTENIESYMKFDLYNILHDVTLLPKHLHSNK